MRYTQHGTWLLVLLVQTICVLCARYTDGVVVLVVRYQYMARYVY